MRLKLQLSNLLRNNFVFAKCICQFFSKGDTLRTTPDRNLGEERGSRDLFENGVKVSGAFLHNLRTINWNAYKIQNADMILTIINIYEDYYLEYDMN